MGEALISRRGVVSKVYDAEQTLSIDLNPSYGGETEITVGFAPDLVIMERTANPSGTGQIWVWYGIGVGSDAWCYGRESSSNLSSESGSYAPNIVRTTDTGFVLGENNRTLRKFSGTYRIYAVKYT